MGHSTGISDSYYRATETELLEDYLKAIDFLTISTENKLMLENQQVKRHNLQIEIDKESNILKIKGTRTSIGFKEDIRRGLKKYLD